MEKIEIVNINVNETFILDLIGMGNAGYTWIYKLIDEGIIKIFHEYINPVDPKPGERGIERFKITGIEKGSCMIEFCQIQIWEKDQPPNSVRKLQINVQ